MAGEIEVVERDSNKRFAHFYKMNISDAVRSEMASVAADIRGDFTNQLIYVWNTIDAKQSYGVMAEMNLARDGIDEWQHSQDESKIPQYHSCIYKLMYGTSNLATQVLFSLSQMPLEVLDQKFIHDTILFLMDAYSSLPATQDYIFEGRKSDYAIL